jgi:hypothetical protein
MKDFEEIGVIYNVGNQEINKECLESWFGNKIYIGCSDDKSDKN